MLGLIVGWLVARLRLIIGQAPVVENTISLLTPFAVFIPAEKLGLASVLAVVTTGLYLGRKGPRQVSAETRLQATAMWEVLSFLLESLIFILIGLELPVIIRAVGRQSLWSLVYETLILTGVLIFVRFAYIYLTAYGRRFIERMGGSREPYQPWQNLFFVSWAGIRGGDSLVIALALPLTTAQNVAFPGRDLIIILTFAVILITLVVQGLPLVPILRFLKLHDGNSEQEEEEEEVSARLKVIRKGLERLTQLARDKTYDQKIIDNLREKHEYRLRGLEENNDGGAPNEMETVQDYHRLRLEMIDAERSEVVRLRDEEEISDEVLRRVQEELDLEEVLLTPDDENSDEEDENAGNE